MAFLLLMAVAAMVSFPVKMLLFEATSVRAIGIISFYVITATSSALLWCFLVWHSGLSATFAIHLLRCAGSVGGNASMAAFGAWGLSDEHRKFVGWAMLAWMYVVQTAHVSSKSGYWAHLVNIYLWAVFVHRCPLAGARHVGFGLAKGWPFVFVLGSIVSSFPGMDNFGHRVDRSSSPDLIVRVRHYFIEVLFLLGFTTIPLLGSEHTISMPKLLGKHLPWLNWWSLLSFCDHKAVYYVIGGHPWGILLVLSSAVPFYGLYVLRPARCSGNSKSGDVMQIPTDDSPGRLSWVTESSAEVSAKSSRQGEAETVMSVAPAVQIGWAESEHPPSAPFSPGVGNSEHPPEMLGA